MHATLFEMPSATRSSGKTTVDEILPCPFCGAVPVGVRWGKVKCTNGACLVRPTIRNWYSPGYEAQAIAEWNTRAPTTNLTTGDTCPRDGVDDGPDTDEDA